MEDFQWNFAAPAETELARLWRWLGKRADGMEDVYQLFKLLEKCTCLKGSPAVDFARILMGRYVAERGGEVIDLQTNTPQEKRHVLLFAKGEHEK